MEKKTNINLNRIFIIFLILHIIIWSGISLLRQIFPIDAMECVYWGGLADLGTNKHPPLAGWIAYIVYNLFNKIDLSVYVLGQVMVITGFIYLYKLGKLFLTQTAAILAVMIMEACFVYTYMGIYDGFNPNFLLLAIFPAITYYFYKSVHSGNVWDWVKLGTFVGLSFLAKYQTIILFISLFVYLLITPDGRKQFKNKYLYLAAFIAFLIVLPHIVWLYIHQFFSLNYFVTCEEKYATFYYGPLKYLWSPCAFLINQLVALAGVIFIYMFFWLTQEKPAKPDIKYDDKVFLICAGIMPVFLQSLSGLNGNYMIPQWGYSLLFMSGIMLFYFLPFKLSDKVVKGVLYWVFVAMLISFVVLAIIFATEKNFANRFPVSQVTASLNEIYESETKQKMKYIGGFIELSIPISLYNHGKYIAVLNSYKTPNIWIDDEDMRKSGVIVLGRNPYYMKDYIETTAPMLLNMPKIKTFDFTVKSFCGNERNYTMFYAIIPPNAEYKKNN